MVKFLQIANQNPPFATRHPSVLVWFPYFHWQPPSASAPVVPLKLPSQMSPVISNCQSKEHCSCAYFKLHAGFYAIAFPPFKILPSFGFPSALQPPKSPLTPVFLFNHLISIFPYSLQFLRVACWAVLSSLFMLSLDDFIYTCSFHLDTGFPGTMNLQPRPFSTGFTSIQRAAQPVWPTLVAWILQYGITVLHFSKTWS